MKSKLVDLILNSPTVKTVIGLLDSFRFYKGRVTLFDVISTFYKKVTEDEIVNRASAVAFNFTLAIFPAIIFLFTLIPYIKPFPHLDERILSLLHEWMPDSIYDTAESTVLDIVSRPRGGLLSFGAIFSLYLATNGILALMQSFNACYHIKEKRGFIKTHLTSLILTIMLAIVLVFAVVLLFIGQVVIEYFRELEIITDDLIVYLLLAVRFIVMYVVFQIAVSSIYYFAPAVKYKWSFFSVGSVIATLLILGASYAFSFYISNFATYNKLYGSIGALIGIMMWFFIVSLILLVGYEVNVSIDQTKDEAFYEAENQ